MMKPCDEIQEKWTGEPDTFVEAHLAECADCASIGASMDLLADAPRRDPLSIA